MAVIRYPLVDRTTPSYITDGGYLINDSDGTIIGIGSGGGTDDTYTAGKFVITLYGQPA